MFLGQTTVYSDSQTVITYVKDLKYDGITEHIDVKNNFIEDILAQKEVILKYLPTHEMVTDPFKKHVFCTCKVIKIVWVIIYINYMSWIIIDWI